MTSRIHIDFTEHRLSNGLQVILYRDNRIPLTHVSLHYRVGSSYEQRGQSGLAHLFEHMMFEGSENVVKNEHGRLLDAAGGSWNASTSKDRTNYYATVPSNFLDLALWLEADRMRSLRITPENFENQRQTVIEEKKQSYDNRPYGRAHLRFDELAYSNWAYGHPVIGDVEDLKKLTLEQAIAFHQRFYGPGNAVLVLAGDISEPEALAKVEEYFLPIADRTDKFRPDLSEPAQQQEKQEHHADVLAALPAILLGFHMPEYGSRDHYALAILSLILTQGESSRLYRKMIYDNNWVTSIYSGPNQYKGPQLFTVWSQMQDGNPPERIQAELLEELGRIGQASVSDQELEKARNNISHAFLTRLARVSQIGEALANYAVFLNDPGAINTELERFFTVTAADIQAAADRVFTAANQTAIFVLPQGGAR
ncbi:MAG: insulinase family protein [Acidobacteria bacterium]|nr:MAG: insulinase family protein [Acidobacteriota bacterium]